MNSRPILVPLIITASLLMFIWFLSPLVIVATLIVYSKWIKALKVSKTTKLVSPILIVSASMTMASVLYPPIQLIWFDPSFNSYNTYLNRKMILTKALYVPHKALILPFGVRKLGDVLNLPPVFYNESSGEEEYGYPPYWALIRLLGKPVEAFMARMGAASYIGSSVGYRWIRHFKDLNVMPFYNYSSPAYLLEVANLGDVDGLLTLNLTTKSPVVKEFVDIVKVPRSSRYMFLIPLLLPYGMRFYRNELIVLNVDVEVKALKGGPYSFELWFYQIPTLSLKERDVHLFMFGSDHVDLSLGGSGDWVLMLTGGDLHEAKVEVIMYPTRSYSLFHTLAYRIPSFEADMTVRISALILSLLLLLINYIALTRPLEGKWGILTLFLTIAEMALLPFLQLNIGSIYNAGVGPLWCLVTLLSLMAFGFSLMRRILRIYLKIRITFSLFIA